jgi:hypothetical protein
MGASELAAGRAGDAAFGAAPPPVVTLSAMIAHLQLKSPQDTERPVGLNGRALIVTGREALRFAARPTSAGKPLQIAMV